jgi:hypothetical protein
MRAGKPRWGRDLHEGRRTKPPLCRGRPANTTTESQDNNAAACVATYIERGWGVTPLRGKDAFLKGWQQNPTPADDIDEYWSDGRNNVGILTGEISGNLVDVDLDCDEARSLGRFRQHDPRSSW